MISRYPGLRSGRLWKQEHDLALLDAVLKHGYGRWQAIVDDREFGFQHIICQELNLSFLNGSGGGQLHESANMVNSESTSSAQESGAANDLGSDVGQGSNTCNFREMQRRLVEFIKKRVLLLEKGLNAEYQKEFYADDKSNETATEELETDPMVVDTEGPLLKVNGQISDQLPSVDPITQDEILAAACDKSTDRMDMVRLYNEMCKVISDNDQASVETYPGNKSARLRKNFLPLEAIYEDVHRVLASPHKSEPTSEKSNVDQPSQTDTIATSIPSLQRSGGDPKPGDNASGVDPPNMPNGSSSVPNAGETTTSSKSVMEDTEMEEVDLAEKPEGGVIVLD